MRALVVSFRGYFRSLSNPPGRGIPKTTVIVQQSTTRTRSVSHISHTDTAPKHPGAVPTTTVRRLTYLVLAPIDCGTVLGSAAREPAWDSSFPPSLPEIMGHTFQLILDGCQVIVWLIRTSGWVVVILQMVYRPLCGLSNCRVDGVHHRSSTIIRVSENGGGPVIPQLDQKGWNKQPQTAWWVVLTQRRAPRPTTEIGGCWASCLTPTNTGICRSRSDDVI